MSRTIQEFLPEEIILNPAIMERPGDPDEEFVAQLADSIFDNGQEDVGKVRKDGDKIELIAGKHRLAAIQMLNANLSDGQKPFKFRAEVVSADDSTALTKSVLENEFKLPPTLFERADAMQRLVDSGKTQVQVGKAFNVPESVVSDTLKAGKLPKKYRVMVEKGKMTEEAAIVFARYNKDPKTQEDLLKLAEQTREAEDAIIARAEAHAGAEADAEAESAADEGKKKKKSKGKTEADRVFDQMPKPRKAGGKKQTPGKITASDAKAAVKKKGVQKRTTGPAPGISKNKFITILQALFGPKAQDVPKPVKELAKKIEARLDDEISDAVLQNAFLKCCKESFD